MSISEKYIAELYNKIQEERPIIHCITNAVTVNDCANILLAAGASPTMAHHPLEVEEITAGTKALVCNFGAIADYEAMEKAARVAVIVLIRAHLLRFCLSLQEKHHPYRLLQPHNPETIPDAPRSVSLPLTYYLLLSGNHHVLSYNHNVKT